MNYLLLFLSSSLYSLWLLTPEGNRFSQERTAESVGIGVGLVMLSVAPVIEKRSFYRVLLGFLVAGLPIYTRSLMRRVGE